MPVLRILVLAFALAHASGLTDAMKAACTDECDEGTGCGDGCAPLCATCQCARCPTVVAPEVTATAPALRPPPIRAGYADVERAVSNPDPREILRVPIALRV